jgi:hypothetical protein
MNAKIIKVSDYEDKFITCIDCSDEFLWTASEQAYFTSKELSPPKRCKPCRDYRRTRIIVDNTVKGGEVR